MLQVFQNISNFTAPTTRYKIYKMLNDPASFCPEPPLVTPEEGVGTTPEEGYILTFPGRKKFRLPVLHLFGSFWDLIFGAGTRARPWQKNSLL